MSATQDTARIQAKFEELGPWYHTITHPSGLETPGKGVNIRHKFEKMQPWLPDDLTGKTVLDIGANAGGLSLEFAKRGARVTALEVSEHYSKQARWMAAEHGLPVEVIRKNAYQVSELERSFDYVAMMGLIYHLRHPQLGLDLVASRCKERAFFNTPIVLSDHPVLECRLPEGEYFHGEPQTRIPAEKDPHYNYWFASPSALKMMARCAGFRHVEVIDQKGGGFKSSSAHETNTSGFETGQIWLTGLCDGQRDVLIDMARAEPKGVMGRARVAQRKLNKLRSNPKAFFRDSKLKPLRAFKRFF